VGGVGGQRRGGDEPVRGGHNPQRYPDPPREAPRDQTREMRRDPRDLPRDPRNPPRDPTREIARETTRAMPPPGETQGWPQQATRAQRRAPEPSGGGPPRSRRRAPEPEPEPAGKPKSGRSATVSVLLMTAISLVAVGALAVQASGQSSPAQLRSASTGQSGAAPSTTLAPSGAATNPAAPPVNPLAIPANSGSGLRIVYSPAAKRVWLVEADGTTTQRTFPIVPGTVPVPAGTDHVSNRASGENGSDGVSVQYVVFFDNAATEGSSTAFAFDAEADVSGLPPAPTGHTAAVRMAQADAGAIWYFAPVGTLVVVV